MYIFPETSDTPPHFSSSSATVSPTLIHLLRQEQSVHRIELGHEPKSHPFVLSFNNLTYSVKVRHKFNFTSVFSSTRSLPNVEPSVPRESEFDNNQMKLLLDNISGEARDGEIMAVLGASGSGKSTLIDALANRIAKESLKGTVTLNGEVLESRLLKVISAYVMQDDLLYPMLTVEETLMFAAEFRLPRTLSGSRKKARVQALIDQLGLRNAAKTMIGDEGRRGVSGGERRRVSIGIDIVHNPIVLFLDEPTSGLDSTSAFMVVNVLQRIAQSGSIVIMSIHQPSYRILGLLNHLIFLSRGQTVFSGSPTDLPQFLTEFGHPIPKNENWAEFALDLIRELESSTFGTRPLVEFNKTWETTTTNKKTNTPAHSQKTLKEAIAASKLSTVQASFANSHLVEIAVLSKRSIINSRRMPELFGMRLGTVMVTGFILATMFWRLDNSPKGAQERLSFLSFAMSTTFYTCADALPIFLQERYIFMRETAYNTYRRSSYVISHALVAVPLLVFLSITFSATTFWSVGLDVSFPFYFLIVFASFWSGSSFVTFLSGVISNVVVGYIVVVAMLAYFALFSGFFITRARIPPYWIWFHYLSLIKYPYEAVLQNEFNIPGKCFVRGTQIFDNTVLGDVPTAMKLKLLDSLSETLGVRITMKTCLVTGPDILKSQGVTELSKWSCLWVTVAWGFLFRVLFYFTLLVGSKNKRR